MFANQFRKRLPMLAGLALAGWTIAAAPAALAQMQQPGGGMQNQPGAPGTAPGAPVNPGMNSGPDAENPLMKMQNMQDGGFIKHVFEDDDAQVRMSQLAQQKSSSDDVKQFGEKMVQIHTQLNQQLQPLAKKLDVGEPKKPDKKEKKELAQLQTLSGPAFDAAYIQDMAAEQQRGMKLFADEAKAGEKSRAALTAKRDEPVLAQHFAILQKIAEAHNVPLEAGVKK
ncbi:MAG: DUF4142 domain-containing protein [Acidobacteriota bacterium]